MEVLFLNLLERLRRERCVTIHEDSTMKLAEVLKNERIILQEGTSWIRV